MPTMSWLCAVDQQVLGIHPIGIGIGASDNVEERCIDAIRPGGQNLLLAIFSSAIHQELASILVVGAGLANFAEDALEVLAPSVATTTAISP
ncbi:MAG: hypothetical protein IPK19_25175 [Chloroflexi bacterium]|nr:hypothetical protein [Chloroflexota bacterium]